MKSKYYIPTIDEFKIGFRYYLKYTDDEMLVEFTFNNIDVCLVAVREYLKSTQIRVKYLNTFDIKELGWVQTKEYSNKTVFQFIEDFMVYELAFQDGQVMIERRHNDSLTALDERGKSTCIFNGNVKNYNQLNDLMKMLNIIK